MLLFHIQFQLEALKFIILWQNVEKTPPTYVLLQGTAHGLVILIAIILIKHSVTGDVPSKPNSLDISQGTHSDPLSELPGEPQGPQRPLVF